VYVIRLPQLPPRFSDTDHGEPAARTVERLRLDVNQNRLTPLEGPRERITTHGETDSSSQKLVPTLPKRVEREPSGRVGEDFGRPTGPAEAELRGSDAAGTVDADDAAAERGISGWPWLESQRGRRVGFLRTKPGYVELVY
jgi:hypothetical protein